MSEPDKPILEYARPARTPFNPLHALRIARRVAFFSLIIFIFTIEIGPDVYHWLLAAIVGISSILTLYFMTWAGIARFGVGYGVTSLIAAILLMPIFGIGLFVFSRMVEKDIAEMDGYREINF